jgi:hypothetical protein
VTGVAVCLSATDSMRGRCSGYPLYPHAIGWRGRPIVIRCGAPLHPCFPVSTQRLDNVYPPHWRYNTRNAGASGFSCDAFALMSARRMRPCWLEYIEEVQQNDHHKRYP